MLIVFAKCSRGYVYSTDYGPIFLYDYGDILLTFKLRLKELNLEAQTAKFQQQVPLLQSFAKPNL